MGGAKAHYDGIKAFSETDFTEDLKKITVPVLVMHGDDDQIVPYADSGPLSAKLLKNGTLKTYKGFPHGMLHHRGRHHQRRPAGFHQGMILMRKLLALSFLFLAAPALAAGAPTASTSTLMIQALANAPGQSLTAVMVTYPPGGKSAAHRHPGSVFVYVVSGKVRSQVSTNGPVKIYSPGESFFEPQGSTHLVSENASTTEPASILAVFVAPAGATLTTPAPQDMHDMKDMK